MRHQSALLAIAAALAGLAPAAASAAGPGFGESGPVPPASQDVHRRATNQSPKGYAPSVVDCPADRPVIRKGPDLSRQEKEWLKLRRQNIIQPMREFLKRAAIPDFDSDAYLENVENDMTPLSTIGLGFPGGGYRADIVGGGALAAFDDRSPGSLDPGNLGGLLQCATYISALSGGAWLVGSIYANNFTTVQASAASDVIWQYQNNIAQGPPDVNLLKYYTDIFGAVKAKSDAGFSTTITDIWGIMLAFQLVNATDGGPGLTWSSIANDPIFAQGQAPLPLVLANRRAPGELIISNNSTIFEITPWEYGSYDSWLNGFAPLAFAGSHFVDGVLPDDEDCIVGFDNAGYVIGTSSSLFNELILLLGSNSSGFDLPSDIPEFAVQAIEDILKLLGEDNKDIADWSPNAFRGFNPDDPGFNSDQLFLVDGGEDLQNTPFNPLLQDEREVDVIIAVDMAAETPSNYPDGSAMIKTYERAIQKLNNNSGFPVVPGQNTFINLGLNSRPTFFGCNASNTTNGHAPLVVNIPNFPYFFRSNISTATQSVSKEERDALIENGWGVVTQANSTRDPEWPVCLSCAILARSFERTKTPVPDACTQCFQRYCWNGTLDESTPADYEPEIFGPEIHINSTGRHIASATMSIAISAVVAVLLSL